MRAPRRVRRAGNKELLPCTDLCFGAGPRALDSGSPRDEPVAPRVDLGATPAEGTDNHKHFLYE